MWCYSERATELPLDNVRVPAFAHDDRTADDPLKAMVFAITCVHPFIAALDPEYSRLPVGKYTAPCTTEPEVPLILFSSIVASRSPKNASPEKGPLVGADMFRVRFPERSTFPPTAKVTPVPVIDCPVLLKLPSTM
jgi:hypothetical protein